MSGYRKVAYGCGLAILLLAAAWPGVRYFVFPLLGELAGMRPTFEDPELPAPVLQIPPLAESLAKIERWLADNHVPSAAALRPGLPAGEIDRQLAAAGLKGSAELRTLYGWHDGQEEIGELIPGYRFLPLATAIAENRAPMWRTLLPAEWLPILWVDSTENYVVPTHRNAADTSPLYDFYLEETEVGTPYPSLAAFFAEEEARFAAGAYKIDDEAKFEVDTHREWQVHEAYYPGAGPVHHAVEETRLSDGSLKRIEDLGDGSRFEFLFNPRGHLLHQIYFKGTSERVVRAETVELDAAGRPLLRRYPSKSYPSEVTWEWKENDEVTIRVRVRGNLTSTREARTKSGGGLQVLAAPLLAEDS